MNSTDSSRVHTEQDAPQATKASFLALRTGLGIFIHDPTSRRLLEGAALQLDISPLLLDESALTLESLARFEMIVADAAAMPRIRSLVATWQEWKEGVRPTLVEVISDTADSAAVFREAACDVLVLPQEPALIVSKLSLILLAHRGFAGRYQTALEELYLNKTIFQSVATGITVADATLPGLPLIYVNPAFEVMTGYKFEEIQGNNCRFLQKGDRDQPGLTLIREALKTQHSVVTLLKNYRKDGTPFWNELSLSPVFDRAGTLSRFVGIQMDVTARVEAEIALVESQKQLADLNSQLLHLSVTDALTGLNNRRSFNERLKISLSQAKRSDRPFTLVLLDVDHFKSINDQYGHAAGDDVLRELSRLLEKNARLEDFAARYGGEEFGMIFGGNAANAVSWSQRFYRLLSQSSWPCGAVTVSMGIAEVNPSADDAATILRRADQALYQAKHEGRARAIVHSA